MRGRLQWITVFVAVVKEERFQRAGKACVVRVKPRLVFSGNDAALEVARHGLGVTASAKIRAFKDLMASRLRQQGALR